MKRIIITVFAMMMVATGCQNDDNDQGATKINKSDDSEAIKKKDTDKKVEKKEKVNPKKEIIKKEEKKEKVTGDKKHKATGTIDGYSFVTTDGKVDITSKDFVDYYFSGNRRVEFANIKAGMSRTEVEATYGASVGEGIGAQSPMGERYGDIIVVYDADDIVEYLAIVPSQKLNPEDIKALYGAPSTDVIEESKSGKSGAYMPVYIYDSNKNNGYSVSVYFDDYENGNVRLIETYSEDGDISNVENETVTPHDYTDETENLLKKYEADPSDKELENLLWSHIIRGRGPINHNTEEKIKKRYIDQFNRYAKLNSDAEKYRWLIEEAR